MYNIYKILEDGVVIYVGYSRFSCEELKENIEKYKESTIKNKHQEYITEKGVEKFEYCMISSVEDIMNARVLRKKYIEEYKPRLNSEYNSNKVSKKNIEVTKGKAQGVRYTYFRSGGRLFAVPIVSLNEILDGSAGKKAKGGANSTTDVQGVQ